MNTETQNSAIDSKDPDTAQARFPIRVLADKTTVGTSTLRAWERRYGLLKPERTPKGHRLYSKMDVKRVRKILELLDDGHTLPAIAKLLPDIETYTDDTYTDSQKLYSTEKAAPSTAMSTIWDEFVKSTLEATSDFNIERIDAIYNEASSLYPVDMVIDRLVQPSITLLGKAWIEHPERGVAEEHFYTSWLKNKLGARFHHACAQARGARIICACTPGSYHEIGLMLFALSALAHGYRVLYFGADLPFNQLKYITERSAAKAVVLSAQTQVAPNINQELTALLSKLKTPVFMGGINKKIDTGRFEAAGGILLGENISVAMRVFESHIPPYSRSRDSE